MMDSSVNNLRLICMIITVGFQTCVRSDPLMLIGNNIDTALLLEVFVVIPVSLKGCVYDCVTIIQIVLLYCCNTKGKSSTF